MDWADQRPEQHHQKVRSQSGKRDRIVWHSHLRGVQGWLVQCLRPSRAKDGWYCHHVQLFHCYWSVWNPHSHRRQKSLGGWFLEGCGRKLGVVQSHTFGDSCQLCCHSVIGCLDIRTEALTVKRRKTSSELVDCKETMSTSGVRCRGRKLHVKPFWEFDGCQEPNVTRVSVSRAHWHQRRFQRPSASSNAHCWDGQCEDHPWRMTSQCVMLEDLITRV